MTLPTNSNPSAFAVRIAPEASAQAVAISDRLGEQWPNAAEQWRESLRAAWASLATLPLRCPIADENAAFQKFRASTPLRVLLLRQSRRPAWRILFTAHEATTDDPAFVQVHLIRHSAQQPVTAWPPDTPAPDTSAA